MTDFQIVELDKFATKMDELKDIANFIPNCADDEGYEKSKRVHLDIRKIEIELEKARKEKKSYYIEGGKEVDSQAKAISAKIEALRLPHTEAYQAVDSARKEREAKRKAELEQRVADIRNLPELLADSSSEGVKMALESLQVEECLDFYEFTQEALKARNSSRDALSKMFADKLQAEKDAAELERLRKEAEERAQKDREDAIRKDAAEKAEREKVEAERREQEAKDAAAKAEADKLAAVEAAKVAAENARIQAAKDAEAAAEQARLAEVARQEEEAKRLADEAAKREANKKHVGNIRREAKEDLISLGVDEATAKKIVMAINGKSVRHISITY